MLFSSYPLRGYAKRYWRDFSRSWLRALVLLAGTGVTCLSAPALAASDPARADLPGIAPVYRSAFAGYRGWQDQTVQAWTASNDAAARAGGWRAYAREAAREAARETAPPAAAFPAVPRVDQQPAKGPAHAH